SSCTTSVTLRMGHAMIQDGDGRKMSKSLGNGVDPLDIIHSHGADAMRFTLVEMTTQTQDVRMPVVKDEATGRNTSPKFDLGRNFCNKLWNAARFAMGILEQAEPSPDPAVPIDPAALSLADRWMLSRLHAGVHEVESSLAEYQFSSYAKALYDVVRRDFCDWYLEAIKPTARESASQQAVLRCVLDALLRVCHPVIPFITEAISERLADLPAAEISGVFLTAPRRGGVVCTAGWPVVDHAVVDANAAERFERARALVDAIRQVRSQHQVNPKRRITIHVSDALAAEITAAEGLVQTLAVVESVETTPPEGDSVGFTFDGAEYRASNLADAVDAGAELERLRKQEAALAGKVANFEKRLSNPGYTEKAPAKLVDQTRGELASAQAELAVTRDAITRIGGS
ncbi:MAG: class I tRNA ligase family protein, partial [Planctomycetota bacterium]